MRVVVSTRSREKGLAAELERRPEPIERTGGKSRAPVPTLHPQLCPLLGHQRNLKVRAEHSEKGQPGSAEAVIEYLLHSIVVGRSASLSKVLRFVLPFLVLLVAVAALVVFSIQGGGSAGQVTYGDTGDCIGRWSQPYNSGVQARVAQLAARFSHDGLPRAAMAFPGGRCRVAVVASGASEAPALVFEQLPRSNEFRPLTRRPIAASRLPKELRRWVTRADRNGVLIGHP